MIESSNQAVCVQSDFSSHSLHPESLISFLHFLPSDAQILLCFPAPHSVQRPHRHPPLPVSPPPPLPPLPLASHFTHRLPLYLSSLLPFSSPAVSLSPSLLPPCTITRLDLHAETPTPHISERPCIFIITIFFFVVFVFFLFHSFLIGWIEFVGRR